MRYKLYKLICSDHNTVFSKIYDFFFLAVIVISIVPLTMKDSGLFGYWVDRITLAIFIIDYLLGWIVADHKLHAGADSFFWYPFTPYSIINVLAILPSFHLLPYSFKVLKFFRIIRIFNLLGHIRISHGFYVLMHTIKREAKAIAAVFALVALYVFGVAVVLFTLEPQNFPVFFDAFYWSVSALTTLDYSMGGQASILALVLNMISSGVGILVLAMPSGLILYGLINQEPADKKEAEEKKRRAALL